jgi:hypothetical protein
MLLKREVAYRYGISMATFLLMLRDIPELKGSKKRKLRPKDIELIEEKYGKIPKVSVVNK